MVEGQRSLERVYFNSQLVRIDGVDFTQPWETIAPEVNAQLAPLGYEAIRPDVPYRLLFSNLNTKQSDALHFDPVRVDYNPRRESYTPMEKAAAKLGLQAAYWNGLAEVLDPTRQDHLPYGDYQQFACIPVFKRGNHFYLHGERAINQITSIQYAGDVDMISYAKGRFMTVDGQVVHFALFDPSQDYEQYLEEYIQLRDKLNTATDRARIAAAKSLLEDKELMSYLQQLFPGIEQIIAQTEDFSRSLYLDLAAKVISEWRPVNPPNPPYKVVSLLDKFKVALSSFIFHQGKGRYDRELFWDQEFYPAIRQLGEVTSFLYEIATHGLTKES